KETKKIDKELWRYHGGLGVFPFSWSKDSRWLAFEKDLENQNSAIALYDTKEGKLHQVTSGFYNDEAPVFDPDGKYLYYRSSRDFSPIYSDIDNTWIYPNSVNLVLVPLRKDVASPLSPRNDDEPGKDKKSDKEKKPEDPEKKKEKKPDEPKEEKKDEKGEEKKSKEEKPPKPVEIDLADFERRAIVLPAKAGYYGDLQAVSG